MMTRPDPQPEPSDLLKQETELVEAGLKLLLAEMQALATLIQHSEHPAPDPTPDPATDAEIEAGFDNMPI